MSTGSKSAPKEVRLSELPGISAAAVVALERVGLLNCSDLVTADFHRLAYLLDDYNEATRLVREARRICGAWGASSRESGDPIPPGPLGASTTMRQQKLSERKGTAAVPVHTMPAPKTTASKGGNMGLTAAIGVLGAGLSDSEGPDRETLQRRLSILMNLLHHSASESELIAAAALEAVEAGAVDLEALMEQFGKACVMLLEECMTLRAVPVLPTGRLPQMFIDAAKNASPESRRVCAAHLAALAAHGGDPSYMKLHLEALSAGGNDPLLETAATAIRAKRRAA